MNIKCKNIPIELASFQQWVCWVYEDRDGKPTKVPKSPYTGLNTGVSDPTTWGWFPDAVIATHGGPQCGIGFVFTETDPYVGIDVDDCIGLDGSYTDEGKQALAAFGASYHEVSPSGKGLKFWIKATLPTEKTGRKNTKLKVEAYRCSRFFTVTGNIVGDQPKPILDCNEALHIWYAQKFPPDVDVDAVDIEKIECPHSVQEIIAKATSADVKFAELFDGNWEANHPSQSEADLALCSRIASLTGPDPERIDEVFRESELYREKWERNDYRTKTIKMAIAYAARTYHDPMKDFASLADQLRNSTFQQGSTTVAIPSFPNSVISVSPSAPEWPEPQLLTSNVAVEMSWEDFPAVLSPIVCAVANYTETPIELPGLIALGVLATACQRKYEACLPDGHTEPLCLWVCAAMEPGNRKTAVVNEIVKPLRGWESDQQIRLKPAVAENASRRKTIEKRIDHLRAAAARTDDAPKRQDLEQQIINLERELPLILHYPLLMTDDCTPEKLAALMSEQDERMAIIADEGGVFGHMAGRYSKGVPNLEGYLQGHAGSSVRVHRGCRAPIDLKAPCLTIAVSPQPTQLQKFATNPAIIDRGVMERFLVAIPKSFIGYRHLQSRPIPEEISYQWDQIIRGILDVPLKRSESGVPVPRRLHLSDDAYRIWKDEQRANEQEMQPGNACSSAKGWAAKYPGAVRRIAAIIHIATMVSRGIAPEDCRIDDMCMISAIRLSRKIKQHSLQAFGLMQLDANQHMAHRLCEWIQRQRLMAFTAREAARVLNSSRNDGFDEALKILEESGWIRPTPEPAVRGKGRPSIQFDVNPLVFGTR